MSTGWQLAPVVTAVPGYNTDISNSVKIDMDGVNAIEIAGQATAGTGTLILLRKRWIDSSNFQWQPYAVDKGPNPTEDAGAEGWFWDAKALSDPALKNEEFALLNPASRLTLATTDQGKPKIRAMAY